MNNNNNNNNIIIKPVITYINADIHKSIIYKDNKNKSAIYRWVNNINNKSYVGSAKSLNDRLKIYFSPNTLKKRLERSSSAINSALLKYGYSNFKLEILEYCKPDQLISREQYYIDFLKPEYNICKTAGSTLGKIHSESTKEKIRNSTRGKNHRLFGKHHTYETRKNIGKALKLLNQITPRIMPKMRFETKLKLSLVSISINVKVFDLKDSFIKEFPSINSAAKFFDVSNTTISRAIKKGRSYQNFTFKSEIKDNKVWVYDSDHKLVKVCDNSSKASEWFNIPSATLSRYIKSGKLWKDKYYFYKNLKT